MEMFDHIKPDPVVEQPEEPQYDRLSKADPELSDADILRQIPEYHAVDLLDGDASDADQAKRYAMLFSGFMKYMPAEKVWYIYHPTKNRWLAETEKRGIASRGLRVMQTLIEDAMEEGIDKMMQEVGVLGETSDDKQKRKEILRQIAQMQGKASCLKEYKKQTSVLSIAERMNEFTIRPDYFDNAIEEINCLNGVVDLRNNALLPPEPDRLASKQCYAEFRNYTSNKHFEHDMAWIVNGRPGLREYLQFVFGQCLIGRNVEKTMYVIQGESNTLKSMVNSLVAAVLQDYAFQAPATFLLGQNAKSGHQETLANTQGCRVLLMNESREGVAIDTAFLKSISAADEQRASKKGQHEKEFKPKFTPILFTNWPIQIAITDSAVINRVKIIPFDHVMPDEMQIKSYEDIMLTPSYKSAFFNFAIEGAQRYLRGEKAEVPECVEMATAAAVNESNDLTWFFEAQMRFDSKLEFEFGPVYARYQSECVKRRVPAKEILTYKMFSLALRNMGCEKFRTHEGKKWTGACLRDDVPYDSF